MEHCMGFEDSHAPQPEEHRRYCPSDNLLQLTCALPPEPRAAARRDSGPALRAEGPARAVDVLNLSRTTPTLLPEVLRAAADQAFAMAADPINLLDNNPHIGREWSAVALELSPVAASLERRVFSLLFTNALD